MRERECEDAKPLLDVSDSTCSWAGMSDGEARNIWNNDIAGAVLLGSRALVARASASMTLTTRTRDQFPVGSDGFLDALSLNLGGTKARRFGRRTG